MKNCKYPKCNKKVYQNHALFCLEHSRKFKENGKKVASGVVAVLLSVALKGSHQNSSK